MALLKVVYILNIHQTENPTGVGGWGGKRGCVRKGTFGGGGGGGILMFIML